MQTITITTYPSMPGRFRVVSAGRGRPVGRDASDPGEAAAIALNYAAEVGAYVIVGNKAALDMIPAELRMKRA